jgi:CubicO group peptidase (beta-lactamase class C family)
MARHAYLAYILVVAALISSFICGCGQNTESGPEAGPYAAGAQYSREHNGLALLVYEGNRITYIDNQNGGSVDVANHIFSGTKSFNCAIAIAAVGDGLLANFDEIVSNTITEWATDPVRSTITVRQLLNFTSGLQQKLLNLYLFAKDSFMFAAATRAAATPGTIFEYGETHHAVFEELMERKLRASVSFSNLDPLGYLKLKVLDPIGMSYDVWLRSQQGSPFLSFGAFVTAREWLKYGILLRDNGVFNGTTILNNALLTQCLTASAANPGYGMNFWLNAAMPSTFSGFQLAQYVSPSFTQGGPNGLIWPRGDTDLFAAVGVNDNRLYVFRNRNTVVVRMGRGGALSTWSDAEFLNALLGTP